VKSIIKILEERIRQEEEERKAQKEKELELQKKAVELVKEALREEGYDPEDVVLISYRPTLYRDRVDVSVHLSPAGYRLSPMRTSEPSIFCRFFESGEAQLEYVAEAIEDLVNPLYWEKIPEPPPEPPKPEPPEPEDEIAEIKAALRKVCTWAGIG